MCPSQGFYNLAQGKWEGLSTLYSFTHYAHTSHQSVVALASTSAPDCGPGQQLVAHRVGRESSVGFVALTQKLIGTLFAIAKRGGNTR